MPSLHDDFYSTSKIVAVGSGRRYFFETGFPAGTRVIFVAATSFSSPGVWPFSTGDSQGNSYSINTRINDAGSVAIIRSTLVNPIGAGDYINLFSFGGAPEGYYQLWSHSSPSSAFLGANSGQILSFPLEDKLSTPVSLIQATGGLPYGGAVIGVMQFTRVAALPDLAFSGSAQAGSHVWTSPTLAPGGFAAAWWGDTLPVGGGLTLTQTGTASDKIFGWQAAQIILVNEAPPPGVINCVRHARTNNGRLLVGVGATDGATARRYNDALPPALMETLTLDAGSVDHVAVICRPSQWIDVAYGVGGAVKLVTSKDRGRSFGSAMTVIGSGYQNPTAVWDRYRQRLVVAMQETSGGGWYVTLAGLDADGNVSTSWSTPVLIASGSANKAADLKQDPDGGFTFSFLNSSGAVTVVRCRKLANDGTGTWS